MLRDIEVVGRVKSWLVGLTREPQQYEGPEGPAGETSPKPPAKIVKHPT